jgi:hypothetical protein
MAAAHEGSSRIRLEIGKLPPELDGVKVEVHETVAPQLVLENPTEKTIEILDDAGVAFLRIGSGGVEANMAAAAWYLTYNPGASAPKQAQQTDAEPRWKRVSLKPSWGWYDLRLRTDSIMLPHRIVDSGLAAEIGRWEVPIRVGGVSTVISGTFRYEPPPRYVFLSQLTSPPELAPGVQVMLIQGGIPALFLQNRSGQSVIVFGKSNEPFLRIGPEGVQANALSPSWQESMRASGSVRENNVDTASQPKWEVVSGSSSYAWIEPRAMHSAQESDGAGRTKEFRWEIPIQIGDKRMRVAGLTVLKPAFRAEFETARGAVKAGEAATLIFTVKNARDVTVRDLAIVHEKPMHLLVVSNDLAEFYHIHPEQQPDGSYRVVHTFPWGGDYKLYADFTPPGAPRIVERFDLAVAGRARHRIALVRDTGLTKTVDGLRVTMRPDVPLRAGQELMLSFTVADAKSGRPAIGLEPYLGALAHFVIISEDAADFLHAHPMVQAGSGEGAPAEAGGRKAQPSSAEVEVAAHTSFPRSGLYKLWAQFQYHGRVITVPYVVRVAEAARAVEVQVGSGGEQPVPADAIKVIVSAAGYKPASISVKKGQTVRLAFYRADDRNCGGKVIFPSLGIQRDLPVGRVTVIELKPQQEGQLAFTCGMSMFRGALVVE